MVTVGLYYVVRPGKEKIFEETADEVIALLGKNPGHAKSFLYHEVKNPRSYAIISEWHSRQAFTDFIKSATFKQVTTFGKDQLLEQKPRHRVYGTERQVNE